MKFAICNEMFVNKPVFEVIECVAGLGYAAVELAPFTLSKDVASLSEGEQRAVARCAADNGIEVMGLHWLLAAPEGLHVTLADASVRRRTQDFFRKLIEIAANTGGRILTLGSPDQRSFQEDESHELAAQRLVAFFQELAPELEAAGVTVALEPLETEFTNFMVRTEKTCRIADAIGSEAIGITLDTHFLRWECKEIDVSYLEMLQLAGDRLVHLHIQDDNYLAPGTGNADFSEYAEAVKAIGWDRYISFESLFVKEEGRGEELAADCIHFLKELFA